MQTGTSYKNLIVLSLNCKHRNDLFYLFLVLPTERPMSNDQPRSNEHPCASRLCYLECHLPLKGTSLRGELTDSISRQKTENVQDQPGTFGQSEIKEVGPCPKNLKANLGGSKWPKMEQFAQQKRTAMDVKFISSK